MGILDLDSSTTVRRLASAFILVSVIVLIASLDWMAKWVRRLLSRARAAEYRICPKCGYDLRSCAEVGSCPECGTVYDPQWLERTWEAPQRRRLVGLRSKQP
jgi:uncharacterized protein with PIN domain